MSSVHEGLDVRIFHKECVSTAQAGAETHLVIAASPADVATAAANGVTLHALSSPGGRLNRMFVQAWRCYRVARALNADIYHFHDPELIPFGVLLRLEGKRVIYDAHEDLPRQIMAKTWIWPWARQLVARGAEAVENLSARYCFRVIAATPFIAARFHRVAPASIDVNNYPWPDELVSSESWATKRRGQVCYVGGIARIRGIEPLIRALPLVPDVILALCGRFEDPVFELAMRALPGWKQVDYRGPLDRRGVKTVLSESVAGLVTLLPTKNYVDSRPVKMFEYMSAELPVIASDFPLWRQIIEGERAGICVDPENPEAIAVAIRQVVDDPELAQRMGRAGRTAVLRKYNWPGEAEKLVQQYRDLLPAAR